MFRNQYDNDVTVWSPQGRLHQVEYAMEAVKQGSATVGLKNASHAVLVALKRASSELSSHQKKVVAIDDHLGISIAGLTADARMLSRYMRTECLNHRYAHGGPLPTTRLIATLGNKMQVCTQRYDRRPYGVGLLVASHDEHGPHVYQTCPSANYFDCRAMAIGARSQSARTYLEKNLDRFKDAPLDELINHGLRALRDTLPNEIELSDKNVSIGVVGEGQQFVVYNDESVTKYLGFVETEERRGGTSSEAALQPVDAAASGGPDTGADPGAGAPSVATEGLPHSMDTE